VPVPGSPGPRDPNSRSRSSHHDSQTEPPSPACSAGSPGWVDPACLTRPLPHLRGLTLSGVSLATPQRTHATHVTWRLRFMVLSSQAFQERDPATARDAPAVQSSHARASRGATNLQSAGAVPDVTRRRRREGGGAVWGGRGCVQCGENAFWGCQSCRGVCRLRGGKAPAIFMHQFHSLLGDKW
jgi:hypothetical protein